MLEHQVLHLMAQALFEWKRENLPKEKISFTRAILSRDKRYADVYVSIFDPEGDQKLVQELFEKIQNNVKYFRNFLGRNLKIYVTPEVRFILDHGIEQSVHMQKILDELAQKENRIPASSEGKQSGEV